MQDDEFNVTTRTSVYRRDAVPLIREGYGVLTQASLAAWRRLQNRLLSRLNVRHLLCKRSK